MLPPKSRSPWPRRLAPGSILLGRTPAPAAEPDWLARIHEEPQIKRALLERSNGRRPLQEVGEEARRVLAQREIRRQLARIERAGSSGDLPLGRRARRGRRERPDGRNPE